MGCDEAAQTKGSAPIAADYAGIVGTVYGYAPAETPDATPVLLAITEGRWELRQGNDWDDAPPIAVYSVVVDAAITVEGVELLPSGFTAGEAYAGYYGEFSDTATRNVEGGSFTGKWTFARDLGPVRLTLDGAELELVSYQGGLLDTGV